MGWKETLEKNIVWFALCMLAVGWGVGVATCRIFPQVAGISAPLPTPSAPKEVSDSGQGGKGGGGNALGNGSVVVGGNGGPAGSPGFGRGGDGGGGDAAGGGMVIGGDGGGAGRSDGRGGAGAQSALRKLSPETLRSFGLKGDEDYGRGGDAANSPEYKRMMRVIIALSVEYLDANPTAQLHPMPGVLMPPVVWLNERLEKKGENFRVDLIEAGSDFMFRSIQ